MKSLETLDYKLSINDPLLDKACSLLLVAKNGETNPEIIDMVALLTKDESPDPRLGRVFGYSISDFAFAALKWLNTPYSLQHFDALSQNLSEDRMRFINGLISQEGYRNF